jgi:hypothetical protein
MPVLPYRAEAFFAMKDLRVHIDPTQDGAEAVNMVCGRVRAELLRRIGLEAIQQNAQHRSQLVRVALEN